MGQRDGNRIIHAGIGINDKFHRSDLRRRL
jgi:hypothetical protein